MCRWLRWSAFLLLAGCGQDAARVTFDDAVARLRAGDFDGAQVAAAQAAQQGGSTYEALHAFVRGNVSFARSMDLDVEVNQPDADPRARAGALAFAEDALAFWRAAAATRSDWPAARRNVERALVRLEALREKGKSKRKPPPTPKKDDDPKPREAQVEARELPPAQVMAILDRLREKAEQKRQARQALRRAASARVERDW